MNALCTTASCASVRWSKKLESKAPASRAGLKRAPYRHPGGLRGRSVVRATFGEGPESSTMDYQGALKFLGLSESATSEEMVRAKNKMLSKYDDAKEKLETVEAAYDVVLMKSLMKRSKGEVSDNRVKYADVLSPGATVRQNLPPWARDLMTKLPKLPPGPAFEVAESETLTQGGIAFGVLAALVLVQGCTQPFGAEDAPPGFQLSLGLFASVWLLRKKNIKLGRSISLAVLGLIVGSMVGGLAQGWLCVDIVPLGALSSPSAVVSEFGLVGMFVASSFLY
mmetsp:Transcript_15146/g.36668  ORF Transcript_15146/g.36668 Transcript_15146/m.36668 type:complete len:281 (+) Transcript_15146:264-1106(+)|eukprot:CAMPEP_0197583674 /NCGR_PEP_ID=MMETSP1326-20131121/6513_1 /TAXON_ID=1155430 /ORGANISM="Genus nov. species nov., Strain RCC2288" /LENGTH=280 /DNA_ID=CAMNT_0043147929 /DNA_START=280 /DNA_END=1122 /DNA_ORIENTATION=-